MTDGVYLDLHFDPDWVGCTTAGAWVVPVSISQLASGVSHFAHDCCSPAELEFVLAQMENDIANIRTRAKRLFVGDMANRRA